MKRIAVTGGTGFVGAALINLLLEQGFDVTAMARNPKRLEHAPDVKIIPGDLADDGALERLAAGADAFVHLAGVTHPRRDGDYPVINVEGAVSAAKAAAGAGAKFVHASSMSARAPETSLYARSKYESEAAVRSASQANPWLALRLPAIYGPGDLVTLPYFRLIKSGLALEPRTETGARASILFVEDAARALSAAATSDAANDVYEVGDERPEGFAWSEIGEILGKVLEKRPIRLRVPRPMIAVFHSLTRATESAFNRPPSVRTGQINEFFHPDWVARENHFSVATGWSPQTPLHEGFAKTVLWYQERGLL